MRQLRGVSHVLSADKVEPCSDSWEPTIAGVVSGPGVKEIHGDLGTRGLRTYSGMRSSSEAESDKQSALSSVMMNSPRVEYVFEVPLHLKGSFSDDLVCPSVSSRSRPPLLSSLICQNLLSIVEVMRVGYKVIAWERSAKYVEQVRCSNDGEAHGACGFS